MISKLSSSSSTAKTDPRLMVVTPFKECANAWRVNPFRRRCTRYHHGESHAFVSIVLDANRALVLCHDLAANRQTEAGTAGLGSGFARLYKFIENRFKFVLWNAAPLVSDLNRQRRHRAALRDLPLA